MELYTLLPEEEKLMVDVLRQIVLEALPEYCKEKISYNVRSFMAIEASVLSDRPPYPGEALEKA